MAASLSRETVLVLGASGQVGRFAVPMLVASGACIVAVSRRGRPDGYPRFETVEWVQPNAAKEVAARATMMLSAGPLSLVADWLGQGRHVHRVAATSSTSVITKLDSDDPAERALMARLRATEDHLSEACAVREVTRCLLRPTMIYGAGMDRNLTRLASFIDRFGFLPVAGKAPGLRQPLHAEDLAAALVAGLFRGVDIEAPLTGGEALTYREMAGRMFDALGRRRRVVPLPPGLLSLAVRLAGGDASPAMVRRQSKDLVFDDSATRHALGVRPRSFHPRAEDFSPPARRRLQVLARTGPPGRVAQEC